MKLNGLQENTVQFKGQVSHSEETLYKAYPSTEIDTTYVMILFINHLNSKCLLVSPKRAFSLKVSVSFINISKHIEDSLPLNLTCKSRYGLKC